MAENPRTHDPEYNTEAIHSETGDPWFEKEEPPDETYHPHEEELIHEYAPQEREVKIGETPYYTPLVNTGGEYEPEPYDPSPEPDAFHIMTYGTVEDVAFSENGDDEEDPDSRREGLVSLSLRDNMDDLIHTDFHSLNPLSLLSETNVKVGDQVRIDIQDYKNVIEWFVYNYPMLLKEVDLLNVRTPDGPWFYDDMQTTLNDDPPKANPMYGKNCKGGSLTQEPKVFTPNLGTGEDWEHQVVGSQLDKSYLEIGQRDGNKKITLRQFLELLDDYFQISELWKTVRDHEKRLVHLERDVRLEDEVRTHYVRKEIDVSYFPRLGTTPDTPSWKTPFGHPAIFEGNVEGQYFSLRLVHQDAYKVPNQLSSGIETVFQDPSLYIEKGGKPAIKVLNADAIPEEFRPSEYRWVKNYGMTYSTLGGATNVVTGWCQLDFGFDTDGSVWIDGRAFTGNLIAGDKAGTFSIFGPGSQIPLADFDAPGHRGTIVETTGAIIMIGADVTDW